MLDIIRDSAFGGLLNWLTNGRLASYPEERPNFVLPARYRQPAPADVGAVQQPHLRPTASRPTPIRTFSVDFETLARAPSLAEAALTRTRSRTQGAPAGGPLQVEQPEREKGQQFEVCWEENDQDNPRNWSKFKQRFIGLQIALLTFSVYSAASMITVAIPSIEDDFGVSQVVAILSFSLFMFGCVLFPFCSFFSVIISPIQEMPSVGRNPPYLIGLAFFVLFSGIPTAAGSSLPVLLTFRFLAGFVGSPALATGGASMTDVFRVEEQAMAVGIWAMGAACGPLLGPPIAGFAVQANGWRWSLYITMWLSGFTLILLFFFLPETMEANILLRRARRLRKATGNDKFKTGCEISMVAEVKALDLLVVNAKRAVRLAFEPALFVANMHIALVYSILALFFESFPLVFAQNHGFNVGQTGLAFLCFAVPAPFTLYGYYLYQKHVVSPRIFNPPPGKPFPPEGRLEIGLFAGILIPISLLIFGWTGRDPDVHWIWSMFGAAFYLPGIYLTFQSILLYIAMSYPAYAASIFAGNDFFRSCFAAPFPLFALNFFHALGIGGGNTFLAGASLGTTGFLYLIYRYGARLRARSRFTG
ncbi:hypothetical protein JCM8547_003195 [Rhodosporidiobolus lusitaniae]